MVTEQKEQIPKQEIREIPDTPEPSEITEDLGVEHIPTKPAPQSVDDTSPTGQTKPSVQSDDLGDEELKALSKGSTEESITWWAVFIEKLRKQAKHFGTKLPGKKKAK